ncbi:Methyltransferase type 12 [Gloeothece citriformis PCC 7424]|uniref:Methyltransferase type 12 n=1 Tax=Gloeothece citriformis (strain PCC 7424) TaxID=65393 RepID=B7KB46_GLOC7|nr:class I SAM-dependent methyltransferase [Gloeothece citriformis]ACK70156.1 Methyltransferase type 12 [Gloeothece citriformis PCC 7424]
MNQDPIEQIKRSWEANAPAWTEAVRSGAIESRTLATNAAIVQALWERTPRLVLDLGCGEGWLTRILRERGIEAVGVDGSAQLIELAQEKGGGIFHHYSYAEIIATPEILGGDFDAIACNFALLEPDILPLLKSLHSCLTPEGVLIIQTVHPWSGRGEDKYSDGWRIETFASFGQGFTEAMPWYFRTLSSWISLLSSGGYFLDDLREPAHPDSGEPLSLLLVAKNKG